MPKAKPSPATFGGRLRALREAAGKSVQQLAAAARVGRQSVYQWERDEREPSWGVVQALAAALGVSTESLRTDGREP